MLLEIIGKILTYISKNSFSKVYVTMNDVYTDLDLQLCQTTF